MASRFSLFSGIIFLLLFFGSACSSEGGGSSTQNQDVPTEAGVKSGPEYTSAYVCPMHCKGSGSDKPGKCPECGMAYVANEDLQKADDHDDHSGHAHDEHEGHNH